MPWSEGNSNGGSEELPIEDIGDIAAVAEEDRLDSDEGRSSVADPSGREKLDLDEIRANPGDVWDGEA